MGKFLEYVFVYVIIGLSLFLWAMSRFEKAAKQAKEIRDRNRRQP